MFLGEDLMHSRDYSDVTSRVIDEEVERILREQEARAGRLLRSTARASPRWPTPCWRRRRSTGHEVGRLVDQAYGRPVHEDQMQIPTFATPEPVNGHPDPEATPDGEGPGSTLPLPSTNWQHREPR